VTAAPPQGLLFALEGIDGAGKSTLQRELLRRLRRRGLSVAAWHEPVRAAIGRAAQSMAPTDPLGAAIEFTVDRWLARPRLERLLRAREAVVSDRSFFSTLAYQGIALPSGTRRALARLQLAASVAPDHVFLLELPLDSAMDRLSGRGKAIEPLERRATLRRVATAYRGFARRNRWTVLDARAPSRILADRAETEIVRRLRSRAHRAGRGRE